MRRRRLWYFVLYKSAEDRTPAGIAVQGSGGVEVPTGHGLVWSHRAGAWRYDPAAAGEWVGDEDYRGMSDEVTREVAEQVAPMVTGGEELPDEETIWWIFQWKGDPPQSQD
jgi:hypothetical protein